MSINDITGDEIKSKLPSKEYSDNYDKVFRKKVKIPDIDTSYEQVEKDYRDETCFHTRPSN